MMRAAPIALIAAVILLAPAAAQAQARAVDMDRFDGRWFEIARNVVEYADPSGEYADLRAWMKRHRLL